MGSGGIYGALGNHWGFWGALTPLLPREPPGTGAAALHHPHLTALHPPHPTCRWASQKLQEHPKTAWTPQTACMTPQFPPNFPCQRVLDGSWWGTGGVLGRSSNPVPSSPELQEEPPDPPGPPNVSTAGALLRQGAGGTGMTGHTRGTGGNGTGGTRGCAGMGRLLGPCRHWNWVTV